MRVIPLQFLKVLHCFLPLLGYALTASPPNFIVIIVDDLGYNDLGLYGSPTIRTPNLDRMIIEGTRFTQFYSAAPICTPSRAAMLTGRLPIRTGIYTNYSYPIDELYRVFLPNSAGCLPENETTVATHLNNNGWYTGLIGKWHLGHNPHRNCMPTRKGFQYFYGLPYSHEEGFPGPEFPESLVFPPIPLVQNESVMEQPVDLEAVTPKYTSQVLALLDIVAGNTPSPGPVDPISPAPGKGQPFFLYVAYEEPHIPLFAAPAFQNVSRRGHYGDAVEQVDDSIGQILNKLRSTGLASNTYVVFASDNGAWLNPNNGLGQGGNPLDGGSNAPFYDGKGSTWEGGLRGPGIFWSPGNIPAGRALMQPVTMMDIMPTFLELAHVNIPANLDGVSIASLLNGSSTVEPHNYIYMWREHTLYAIRGGPWKAHFFTRPGFGFVAPTAHNPPLLFNVEEDPAEAYPVNATTQPDVVAALVAAANAHIASVVPGESQYEATDWSIMPCCNKPYNITEAEKFVSEGYFGLAIWDSCVCSTATTRPAA